MAGDATLEVPALAVVAQVDKTSSSRLSGSGWDAQYMASPILNHLLSLIQHNVLRGFMKNKTTLANFAVHLDSAAVTTPIIFGEERWPNRTMIIPTTSPTTDLAPTWLQSSVLHSDWIDLIPFPRMRDNLIKWEACYDHAELVHDLIGTAIDLSNFSRRQTSAPTSAGIQRVDESHIRDEDVLDRTRHGLILWGEPHSTANWEVTWGFLRKWAWTLDGCDELIAVTNGWRSSRGEEPLVLASR